MPNSAASIKASLKALGDPDKTALFLRFFKSGKGEYAEGDQFFGVTVPEIRTLAKECSDIEKEEVSMLLRDPVHECRLLALIILCGQFQRARNNPDEQEACALFYLEHLDWVNNWDLVDGSAPKILGPYLLDRDRSILRELAASDHLWRQRIAVLSTFAFIRENQFGDTMELAQSFLNHPHDLIHKAVGWMLREVGKRDLELLESFLDENVAEMPRTMLRYAIEKLPESRRQMYLKR